MFGFFNLKFVLFSLFYADLFRYFAVSASEIRVPMTNVDENEASVTKVMSAIEQVLRKIETFDEHFEKIEKLNKKTDKIEKILFQLFEKCYQKINSSKIKIDDESDLNSQSTSIGESKVKTLVNETNTKFQETLKNVELVLNTDNKKASNMCDPNPCLNGGRCKVTSTGSEFECADCPYPMSGKKCENVTCNIYGNKCFRSNDTAYVVYPQYLTWEEANRTCVSEGMRLATPKDKASNQFLVRQLTPSYGTKVYPYFWLGLRRSGYGPYLWVDGSALGDYTGGKANFRINPSGRCGILYLNGGDSMWSPHPCEFHYYPVCEKHIFIL